jgi:hypothetical protein
VLLFCCFAVLPFDDTRIVRVSAGKSPFNDERVLVQPRYRATVSLQSDGWNMNGVEKEEGFLLSCPDLF